MEGRSAFSAPDVWFKKSSAEARLEALDFRV